MKMLQLSYVITMNLLLVLIISVDEAVYHSRDLLPTIRVGCSEGRRGNETGCTPRLGKHSHASKFGFIPGFTIFIWLSKILHI